MTQTLNTNYDWQNVSDDYLNEIIAIENRVALRYINNGQTEKFERAHSNLLAARAERSARWAK